MPGCTVGMRDSTVGALMLYVLAQKETRERTSQC